MPPVLMIAAQALPRKARKLRPPLANTQPPGRPSTRSRRYRPRPRLMDSSVGLWTLALAILVGSTFMDLFHVMEYLWKAAYVFYPEGKLGFAGFHLFSAVCGGWVVRRMPMRPSSCGGQRRRASTGRVPWWGQGEMWSLLPPR